MAVAFNVGIYKSTDTGAPSLSGQVSGNSGIALLLAVLVNGYNSQALTSITRSGTTATATKTSHGYNNDQLIRITGCTQTDYNIDTRITVVDANTFTYTVANSPATPATGSPNAAVCPAGGGWTEPYTATNHAVFKQPGGNGFYLNVDEATAQQLNLRGYETMTGSANAAGTMDSGSSTGPFPTVAQMANGVFLRKSSANDGTARPWVIAATDRHLYIFINDTNTLPLTATSAVAIFGDLCSTKSGDAYATVLLGAASNSGTDANIAQIWANSISQTLPAAHYVCRSYTQVGAAISVWKKPLLTTGMYLAFAQGGSNVPLQIGQYNAGASANGMTLGSANGNIGVSSGAMAFPHLPDGGLYTDGELVFSESTGLVVRGILPGLWCPSTARPLTHLDTYSGAANTTQANKKFLAHNICSGGQVHVETTNTWRTSFYT